MTTEFNCHTYKVRTINELPHREVRNGETVLFSNKEIFEIENRTLSENVYTYTLRKILKTGRKGKSNWVVTYTTKNGMKAKRYIN